MDFNQVPMKYSYKTRLGNWSEEWVMEQENLKDYLKNKEKGQLDTLEIGERKDRIVQPTSITFFPDGFLRFGGQIMLYHNMNKGFLGCNLHDKISGGASEAFNVSLTKCPQPTRRSTFILEKADSEYRDDLVHYGQKILIRTHPEASPKRLLLRSLTITPTSVARVSRYQEVAVTSTELKDCVWVPEHIDHKVRFKYVGEPIKAGESVLLKHMVTGQWLGSDQYIVKNDFGSELEVFAHSYNNFGKTQNLMAERVGKSTVEFPMRKQEDQNTWSFRAAQRPEEQIDESRVVWTS